MTVGRATYCFSRAAEGTEDRFTLQRVLESFAYSTRLYIDRTGLYTVPQLSREPLHVPLARSLNIPHHDLECVEVKGRDGVETDIEEDQGPFEEGVRRIGFGYHGQRTYSVNAHKNGGVSYLQQRGGPCVE